MNTSPQHHPDKNLLTEFAAGCLDSAPAIAVSTHLHYCSHCRNEVRKLEQVGAALFSASVDDDLDQQQVDKPDVESITVSDSAFTSLMEKIEALVGVPKQMADNHTKMALTTLSKKYELMPKVVQKMMTDNPIRWRTVTRNLRSAKLVAGQDKYAVSLQKILAGGQVPEHEHTASEITVVLNGSFSDEDSVYQQGDFLLKNAGDKHQPLASNNDDCLCLSVEQAPVKLTGFFMRWLNPFIRFTPA
ncbi:MAG: putative transcriptional regulator [Candidatus Endobugula sp.]|jgi:putative transcriptional regulator